MLCNDNINVGNENHIFLNKILEKLTYHVGYIIHIYVRGKTKDIYQRF